MHLRGASGEYPVSCTPVSVLPARERVQHGSMHVACFQREPSQSGNEAGFRTSDWPRRHQDQGKPIVPGEHMDVALREASAAQYVGL